MRSALGVPAHITILSPFMPTTAFDANVLAKLGGLFASVDAFEISLTSIGWFGNVVVFVRPDPDAALRQMTTVVAEHWPQWLPYEGTHRDPTPHLTIADNGNISAMIQAAQVVSQFLPLQVEVSEVQLYAGTAEPGTWHHRMTFPLRNRRS